MRAYFCRLRLQEKPPPIETEEGEQTKPYSYPPWGKVRGKSRKRYLWRERKEKSTTRYLLY